MSITNYPNLLIVNNFPPNRKTGTWITLLNLLSGWPSNKLASVYSSADDHFPDGAESDVRCCPIKTWRPRARRFLNFLGPLAVELGLIDYYDEYVTEDRISSWLNSICFTPDIILAVPRYILDVEIARRLAKSRSIPLVWYFHDDWLGMDQYWQKPNGRKRYRPHNLSPRSNYIKEFLDESVGLLAICGAMKSVYQQRYDREFSVYHNPVDIKKFSAKCDYHVDLDKRPFLLRYIGSLWERMQLPGFTMMCDIVEKLNLSGVPVRFEICCSNIFENTINEWHLHRPPNVVYCGELSYDAVPEFLATADALYMNLDFSDETREVSGLSMPTKLTEYMASACPVLFHGPADVPPAEYAQSERWGRVVDDPRPEILERSVRELINDEKLRIELGTRARQLVEDRHRLEIVAGSFQKFLVDRSGSKT